MSRLPKKIGLVLGSGAARGLAHIGVLKYFRNKQVNIEAVVGTSIGALIGAFYARDRDIRDIENLMIGMNWAQFAALIDPGLYFLREGLIHGDRVIKIIHSLLGDITFDDLAVPFGCIATDVESGKEICIRSGKVIDAIRASISIPGLFEPVKFQGRYVMDGGVVNPLPVDVMRQWTKHPILAVDVTVDYEEVLEHKKKTTKKNDYPKSSSSTPSLESINQMFDSFVNDNKTRLKPILELNERIKKQVSSLKTFIKERPPSAIDVILKTLFIMEHKIAEINSKKADILVRPDVAHIDLLEFHRAKEIIGIGIQAAKESFE